MCHLKDNLYRDVSREFILKKWIISFLSSWFPAALKWLSGTYTTFYLSFISTGVLKEWAKFEITSNGCFKPFFEVLRSITGADHWFSLATDACIILWITDILLRILRWLLVKKPMDAEIKRLTQENSNIKQELSNSENELAALQQGVSDGFHRFLAHISECLQCGSQERISLYVIRNVVGGYAVELMQRYSENGEIGKVGRSKYDINEGVIGRAWEDGCFYYTNLPEGDRDFKSYWRQQKREFGYTEDMVKRFSMKARTYFAFKIAYKDDCPGFIVIESLANKFLGEDKLKELCVKNNDFLHFMLSTFRNKVPTFEQAMKEEF